MLEEHLEHGVHREPPLKQSEIDHGDARGFQAKQAHPGTLAETAVEVAFSFKYLGVHLRGDFTWKHKHFQPGEEKKKPLSSPFPQEIEVCWTGGASPDCFL